MTDLLRLSPDYYKSIEREVLQETITNEIAWHVARAHESGLDSPMSAGHLRAIDALENVRGLVHGAGDDGIAIAGMMLDAMQALHEAEAAA